MTTPTPQEIADAYNAAAQHIEQNGWTQNGYVDNYIWGDRGACCAAGALNAVLNDDPENNDDTRHYKLPLLNHLGLRIDLDDAEEDEFSIAIGSWNDAKGRTQDEVVAKLREVADAVRAGGQP
jgi:hypothetical protein